MIRKATRRSLLKQSLPLLLVLALPLEAPAREPRKKKPKPTPRVEVGNASWYGKEFHGRKTASGERFNMYALTAAHRTLPFGTKVMVTNLSNKKSVIVRINDRGPFRKGRIIDLSYGAAKQIDLVRQGVAKVKVEVLKKGKSK